MKFHHRWAITAFYAIAVLPVANAASISGQGTWETTLQGRDMDGNLATFEAYYDTDLDLTWLANANAGAGSSYDNGTSTTDGRMTWANANAWATSLNPYGSGITGWRLPTTIDVGNDGCTNTNIYQGVDCGYNITTHSEMSHMFYVTLGDKAYYNTSGVGPQPGWGLTNTGPFSNVLADVYWSATEYAPFNNAWVFNFDYGSQYHGLETPNFYAWAVHSGDIGAAIVPVPAAAWLFSSGLVGLIGFARRKARAV